MARQLRALFAAAAAATLALDDDIYTLLNFRAAPLNRTVKRRQRAQAFAASRLALKRWRGEGEGRGLAFAHRRHEQGCRGAADRRRASGVCLLEAQPKLKPLMINEKSLYLCTCS